MMKLNENQDELLLEWVLSMPDKQADVLLVRMVSSEMGKKLAQKRKEGRQGWFGTYCSNKTLRKMLLEHVEKGDPVDIINLAGMILARQKLYGKFA